MTIHAASVSLPFPAAEVFAWLERPGALERLTPPWEPVTVLSHSGTVHDGDRVVMKVGRSKLEMVHEDFIAGRQFVDRQARGPFRAWRHVHEVVPTADGCELRDTLDFQLPLDAISRHLVAPWIVRKLDRMFAYRRVALAHDLAQHAAYRASPRLRIAISGASGLIGRPLCAFLTTGGHTVQKLVRRAPRAPDEVRWDPDAGTIDAAALDGCDAIIHLAGENVGGGRWTDARKRRILDSRVDGTGLLARTICGFAHKPRVFVSASAVGYYGEAPPDVCDERSPNGTDFLAHVVASWEAAAAPVDACGVRRVHPRIGVALTPDGGGALAELLTPFKWGVGGPIGNGKQPFSWVAVDDVIYAIHRMIMDDALTGPINVVSPGVVDNQTFARTLGRVLHRPSFMRVPAFAIKALFGELGKVVLLGGQRVTPAVLEGAGFQFSQPSLEVLLRYVLGRAS